MNVNITRWILLAIAALSLVACRGEKEEKMAKRTIIAYLAGDNSLNGDMARNISDMMKGMKRKDCNLVVYFDGKDTVPELFAIVPGKTTAEKRDVISYPEENSASPETLRRVLADAKTLYPAASYGLILGSHATGWLPANARITAASLSERLEEQAGEKPRTRTFGEDRDNGGSLQMDIQEMADAIPEGFEFIFFDACMMSSIEVLYELRDKARYIVATPAEITAAGFPYAEILSLLWGDVNDLKKACEYFYNLNSSFATITLVSTAGLDGLYAIARQVFQGKKEEIAAIPASAFPGEIFKYPRINIPNDVYFDLREFVKYAGTGEQLRQFEEQLAKVVLYTDITNPFWTIPIPDKSRACGISTYIPRGAWATWNVEYFKLAWAGIY
jgi:hypothetical protein